MARPWAKGVIPATREYGGVLIVESILNTHTRARLLADTGAVFTALTQPCLEDLGIDIYRPQGRQHIAVAQSREVVTVPTFRLDCLEVGPFVVEGLEVTLLGLPPELRIDGLLGVNFLERFRVTFDFEDQVLVLRRRTT